MSTPSTSTATDGVQANAPQNAMYDYIIVGSGAGGGPLACRLALADKKVLLIEAGGDPGEKEMHEIPGYHGPSTEEPAMSWSNSVRHYQNDTEQVEDHKYDKRRDPSHPNYDTNLPGSSVSQKGLGKGGIFYPRSSGIGGCTGHHAMIIIRPNDGDWDGIAQMTGDTSWTGANMRQYFAKFERCLYIDEYRGFLGKLAGGFGRVVQFVLKWLNPEAAIDRGGHGDNGWQPTSFIAPGLIRRILKQDSGFAKVLIKTLLSVSDRSGPPKRGEDSLLSDLWALIKRVAISFGVVNRFDPNNINTRRSTSQGAFLIPVGIETENPPKHQNAFDDQGRPLFGKRAGVREFILRTQKQKPNNLRVWSDTHVTRLILGAHPDPKNLSKAVTGVECVKGTHLYHASPEHREQPEGQPIIVNVHSRGEVILSGGSFNTPQLLMLSGIGDYAHIDEINGKPDATLHLPKHVNLEGVGKNLQDRYEVGVISEMNDDFTTLKNVSFKPGDPNDPARTEWVGNKTGLYATNGGSLAIVRRSEYADDKNPAPDLFTFGAPAAFRGYYWDWSKQLFLRTKDAPSEQRSLWTWVILKAYTRNDGGTVRLRNADWHVPPDVCFDSFSNVNNDLEWHKDVKALQQAIEEVRYINERVHQKNPNLFVNELQPGFARANSEDVDSPLGRWIRDEAWGHHACGTCRIGKDPWRANPSELKDKKAVVDSRFRVHGVANLRIVDASIFPKIPGYFILAPVFMVSEKAADTLLADAADGIYPEEVRVLESAAVRKRREQALAVPVLAAPELPDSADTEQKAAYERERAEYDREVEARNNCEQIPPRSVGLALSGGGIRSATFGLGVLQALAAHKRLRFVDFLSTVSGGGYTGSFLGRLFTRPTIMEADDHAGRVEAQLQDNASPPLRWLRRYANYLVSAGEDDKWQMLGIFYRNLFAIHLVIGTFLLAVFGLLVGIGGTPLFQGLTASLPTPPGLFKLEWSVWWWLVAGVVVLMLLPCTLGFWLAPKPGSARPYPPFPLLAWLVLLAGSAVALTQPGGFIYGIAGFVILGLAWLWQEIARLKPGSRGKHEKVVGLRVRNRMTRLLEASLKLAALALFWVVLDTAARNIAREDLTVFLTKVSAGFAPIVAFMRNPLLKGLTPGGGSSPIAVWLSKAIGVVLALLLLLLVNVFAHELSLLNDERWFWGTIVLCALFSAVLGRAFDFLNLTSIHAPYAARILRTFQGASNEARIHGSPSGPFQDVQLVHPDDDIPYEKYRPENSGGPLHLINVCVNETIDHQTSRDVPDRRGLTMTIGSFGVSVANYFATWTRPECLPWWRRFTLWLEGFESDTTDPVALKAIPRNADPGTFHPLGRRDGHPTVPDKFTLGTWIGVSGAAISTGVGQRTSVLVSSLRGLLNLRLGLWWNSGTLAGERPGRFPGNVWRQLKDLPGLLFRVQQLLLAEWRGRFLGPSQPLWNISDGGHQEVTGLYELIRRRVKFMILSDAGEDAGYTFADLGELERQVLVDFQATLKWFSPLDQPAEWALVPEWVRGWIDETQIGLVTGIKRDGGTYSAGLARVSYQTRPGDHSWILLIKPGLGTVQSIPALTTYAKDQLAFPQQSTNDQFFDAAQWESYRRLGEVIASQVLK